MKQVQRRIDALLLQAAVDAGSKPFLILPSGTELDDGSRHDGCTVLTYADVYEQASRLAGAMRRAGVRRGDRVACLIGNSPQMVSFMAACSICGAIAVTLNTMSTQTELVRIFHDCKPVAVFVHAAYQKNMPLQSLPESIRLKVLLTVNAASDAGADWLIFDRFLNDAPALLPDANLPHDDAAIMIYSSGTTGMPKGIVLSHQGVVDNAFAASEVLGYRPDDRLLTLLPLFSSFGFAFDFLHVLLNRCSVVLMPRFDEKRSVELIERHKVTFLAGVPTMFARIFDPANLADHDVSSLRMIDVGGGPVSLRLKQMIQDEAGITVIESYGLTEISPVATAQRPTAFVRTSSCGAPLPGFEVKVVDEHGTPVQPGMPGELLFRSHTFMLGYWGQPELTAAALGGGWLHTGDVGTVDDAGEVHIMDRTKDMIVSNGFNVYPKEVENCIADVQGVQAVAVVGVKDEIRGENIHAFVVPRQGASLDSRALLEHCARHLSRYKVPRAVTLIDSLPLTASGKVQRFRLREIIARESQNPG